MSTFLVRCGFSRRLLASARNLGLVCCALLAAAPVTAQEWPSRPIRLVVPYPTGGVSDILARPIAAKLSLALGQSVVVENRPGASGTIGVGSVARATPDGYTLLLGGISEMTMSPALLKSLPYDPADSLVAVAPVGESPSILVVNGSLPIRSFEQLLDAARQKPGGLSFASSGAGVSNHFQVELLKAEAGVDILHVPYKGGGPALADLSGGHVHGMFATLPSAIPLIRNGRLRPLMITDSVRHPDLPDVPTAAEVGLPNLAVVSWYGIFAPAGTPPAIVERIRASTRQSVADTDFRDQLNKVSARPMTISAADLDKLLKEGLVRWRTVARNAGLQAE